MYTNIIDYTREIKLIPVAENGPGPFIATMTNRGIGICDCT